MSDAVPKFASFKAKKPPAATTLPASTRKASPSRFDYAKAQRLQERHQEASISHQHRRKKQGIQATREVRRSTDEDESQHYTIDRRGDKANIQYEATDQYRVARHHNVGRGQILGLDRRYRIDRDATSTIGLTLTIARSQADTVTQQGISRKLVRHDERTLRLVKSQDMSTPRDHDLAFMSLGSSRKRKPLAASTKDTISSYRSLTGPSDTSKDNVDFDVEIASDSDVGDVVLEADAQARAENARLAQRTKDEPTSLDAWQALIAHQKEMIRPGVRTAKLSTSEQRTLADLRLSLYLKAERLVYDHDRKKLVLGRLEEGAKVWDADKTDREWLDALEHCPEELELWIRHLDRLQTRQRDFRYNDIVADLTSCLVRVQQAAELTTSNVTLDALALVQLHVMLRITKLQHQSGYTELGIALWQAIFHLFVTKPLERSTEELHTAALITFYDTWDEEYTRFGDTRDVTKDAQRHLGSSRGDGPESFSASALADLTITRAAELPGLVSSDEAPDDPFHTILSTDLTTYLVPLRLQYPLHAVIDAWLCFHGLVSLPYHGSLPWRTDRVLFDPALEQNLVLETLVSTVVTSRQTTRESLFTGTLYVSPNTDVLSPDRLMHISRGLSELSELHANDTDLAIYHLAYQSAHYSEVAHKAAKHKIKAQPSNLALYDAAALIEAKCSRPDKAVQIWQTSVSMVRDAEQAISLISSWARFEYARGDMLKARQIISRIHAETTADDEGMTPAARIRVLRTLEDKFDIALHKGDIELAASCSGLCTLLTYISDEHDIMAAILVSEKHISMLDTSKNPDAKLARLKELLAQSRAELIDSHLHAKRPYRARDLISSFEPLLQIFPNNSILLAARTRLRQQSPMSYDPREGIRASLLSGQIDETSLSQCMSSITSAIWRFSKLRALGAGPSPDSIRSLFSNFLLGTDGSGGAMCHAPLLWAMWFSFEHALFRDKISVQAEANRAGTPERSTKVSVKKMSLVRREVEKSAAQLKLVLVHGVRFLPWCREWILNGLVVLDRNDVSGMSSDEASRLWNLLVEREMRLRVERGDSD